MSGTEHPSSMRRKKCKGSSLSLRHSVTSECTPRKKLSFESQFCKRTIKALTLAEAKQYLSFYNVMVVEDSQCYLLTRLTFFFPSLNLWQF